MKDFKKKYIVDMMHVIVVCLIAVCAMLVLSTREIGKENDTKEIYEDEATEEPNEENILTLSADAPEESEEPEITQEPIETAAVETEPNETEFIEADEVKYTLTERYKNIKVSESDIDLMAAVVHHESDNQPFAGQRMVAEVMLNRVKQGDMGGNNIRDVIYAKNQFFYVTDADIARANETNYQAVYAALSETPITDEDVVYFALNPHNDNVFAKIGEHYFCYKW